MKDLSRLASIGLLILAISLFTGRSPVGLLPMVMSLFVMRFRILGWWLTVVFVVAVGAIAVGAVVFVLRRYGITPEAYYSLGVMCGSLVGCTMALVGLLAPGTRRAMEARTLEKAPHAFDPER